MSFGEMWHVLLRRWFIAVPALLLTVVATAGAYTVWPTKYQSELQLTLLSSKSVATQQGDGGNPYMAFSSELDAVVDLLARNLSSNQAVNQLQAMGVAYPYTAGIATNAQGPFLAIDVTGKSPAKILSSMPIITRFAQSRLASMQNSSAAPKNSLIQLIPIAPPSTPAPVLKTKIEAVAGVAVIGLVCSFLLCFLIDNILVKRRQDKLDKTSSVTIQSVTAVADPSPDSEWRGDDTLVLRSDQIVPKDKPRTPQRDERGPALGDARPAGKRVLPGDGARPENEARDISYGRVTRPRP
jgi:hypothetical protein